MIIIVEYKKGRKIYYYEDSSMYNIDSYYYRDEAISIIEYKYISSSEDSCVLSLEEEIRIIYPESYSEFKCYTGDIAYCPICEEWGNMDEMEYVEYSDKYVHRDCVDNDSDYFICRVCDDIFYRENESNREDICTACIQEYEVCNSCGIIERREYMYTDSWGDWYCEDCYRDDDDNELVHNYSYKPKLVFHKNKFETRPLYLGVEIELENSEDIRDILYSINDDDEYDESVMIYKSDSSTHNGAYEAVFQPITLAKHFEESYMERLYFDTVTTTEQDGMHIHLNKDFFEDKHHIDRFINFFEIRKNFTFIFSQRNIEKFNEWCKFHGKDFGDWDYKDRYHTVNLTNKKTVEVRIFQSPDNIDTVYANMELVDTVARITAIEYETASEEWNAFLEKANLYKELRTLLNNLGLNKKEFINKEYIGGAL